MNNHCRVSMEELEHDHRMSQPVKSVFDYSDDVEPLGRENRKRKDGTYTCNPSLTGYQNGEKFGESK